MFSRQLRYRWNLSASYVQGGNHSVVFVGVPQVNVPHISIGNKLGISICRELERVLDFELPFCALFPGTWQGSRCCRGKSAANSYASNDVFHPVQNGVNGSLCYIRYRCFLQLNR